MSHSLVKRVLSLLTAGIVAGSMAVVAPSALAVDPAQSVQGSESAVAVSGDDAGFEPTDGATLSASQKAGKAITYRDGHYYSVTKTGIQPGKYRVRPKSGASWVNVSVGDYNWNTNDTSNTQYYWMGSANDSAIINVYPNQVVYIGSNGGSVWTRLQAYNNKILPSKGWQKRKPSTSYTSDPYGIHPGLYEVKMYDGGSWANITVSDYNSSTNENTNARSYYLNSRTDTQLIKVTAGQRVNIGANGLTAWSKLKEYKNPYLMKAGGYKGLYSGKYYSHYKDIVPGIYRVTVKNSSWANITVEYYNTTTGATGNSRSYYLDGSADAELIRVFPGQRISISTASHGKTLWTWLTKK